MHLEMRYHAIKYLFTIFLLLSCPLSFAYANARKNTETHNKFSTSSKHSSSKNNKENVIKNKQDSILLQRSWQSSSPEANAF
jgi:hypothetical protein